MTTPNDPPAPPADPPADPPAGDPPPPPEPPAGEGQDDDDAKAEGHVTRKEFEDWRREQGEFFAEVREQLGSLKAPEPPAEPEPAPPSPEPKAPEPEPEPEPKGEPESKQPASERSYGSRRWFGGR